MSKEYLLLHYADIPHVDFICEYDGLMRIKVTQYNNRLLFPLIKTAIYAIGEGSLYLFEFVGIKLCGKEEIVNAINWYKNYLKISEMRIIGTGL